MKINCSWPSKLYVDLLSFIRFGLSRKLARKHDINEWPQLKIKIQQRTRIIVGITTF